MKLLLPFVLVAALCALFGCAGSVPSSCASATPDKLANCAYRAAVMEENPYYCYSIQDAEQRATCIRDVGNAEVKKKLQTATAQEQEQIFNSPSSPSQNPSQNTPAPESQPAPEVQPVVVQVSDCQNATGREKDGCIRDKAVASQDLSQCPLISDPSLRDSCISKIARMTKDLSACGSLPSEDDRALCNLYAQGN